MKLMTVLGILLIIIGVVVLALQSFTFKTSEEVAEVGPLQVTQEKERTILLPPILGALTLIGGIVLVIAGARRS
jgi:uncharacterized membrane protein